jgi:hypothetical protein
MMVFRRRIRDAYYTDQIDFQTTESVLGTGEALRMKLLRASIGREPPTPQVNTDLPTREAFYDGDVPEWRPDEETDDDA